MAKKYNIRNDIMYRDYYERLKAIALSVYEWTGLPKTCSAMYLEKCLYTYGRAIFVEDDELRYLNLNVTPSANLNVYEEPLSYTAFSTGYSKEYDRDNCVYIRNNYLEVPTDNAIMIFAEKLARIDIIASINIDAQKTPVLLSCDEKTKTSLQALYNQYDGNKPFIFGNKMLTEKPLTVLKTDAPFVADKLREEKRAVWNEALEYLGINTNPSDKKKERLVVNEVDANNEQIDIQSQSFLLCRREACEAINKKYGLNVSVKKRICGESEVNEKWQNIQSS